MEEYKDQLSKIVDCMKRYESIARNGYVCILLTKKELKYLIDIIETEIDKA